MSGFYGQKKSIKRSSDFDDNDEASDTKIRSRPHDEGDNEEQSTVAPPQKKVTKKSSSSSSSGEIQFELANNRKISVTGKILHAHTHTYTLLLLLLFLDGYAINAYLFTVYFTKLTFFIVVIK